MSYEYRVARRLHVVSLLLYSLLPIPYSLNPDETNTFNPRNDLFDRVWANAQQFFRNGSEGD